MREEKGGEKREEIGERGEMRRERRDEGGGGRKRRRSLSLQISIGIRRVRRTCRSYWHCDLSVCIVFNDSPGFQSIFAELSSDGFSSLVG